MTQQQDSSTTFQEASPVVASASNEATERLRSVRNIVGASSIGAVATAILLFTLFLQTLIWQHLGAFTISALSLPVYIYSWRQAGKGNIDRAVVSLLAIYITLVPPYNLFWTGTNLVTIITLVFPPILALQLLPDRKQIRWVVLASIVAAATAHLVRITSLPWAKVDLTETPILNAFAPTVGGMLGVVFLWLLYRIYRDSRTLRVRLLFDFGTTALVSALIIGGFSIFLNYRDVQQQIEAGQLASGDLSSVYTFVGITIAATFISILIGLGIGYYESSTIANPMTSLAGTAVRIEGGELDLVADIPQFEEVALVARAFNSMTGQLRDLIGNLELRVADRTQALETSAEVSRRLSQILDAQQLVAEVVNEIRSAFDYYHVHIYLFDQTQESLRMVGGTGNAGRQMLADRHTVARGQGLVGRAAETNDVVLVPDVRQEEGWLPNPLLPETNSELAVPISTRNRVLGVLDVQNNKEVGLTDADANLLASIANQIAIALQNAELLSETERQAESLAQLNRMSEELNRASTDNEILSVAATQVDQIIMADHVMLSTLDDDDQFELRTLSNKTNMLLEPNPKWAPDQTAIGNVIFNNRSASYTNIQASDWVDLQTLGERNLRSILIAPLVVTGNVIGALSVSSYELNAYSRRDEDVMRQMTSLLSSAIENVRLTQQTQQALESTAVLYNAGRRLNEATNLQEAVAVIPTDIPVPAINRAILGVFDRSPMGEIESLTVTANWYQGEGTPPPAIGTRFTRDIVNEFDFLFTEQPLYFRDVQRSPRVTPASMNLAKELNVRTTAVLPLYVGARQIGSLILFGDMPHTFSEQETQPYVALATQLASTVETRRLFEQAQARAEQERRVRTITDKIRRGSDRETIIRIAQKEIGELLGASKSSVRLGTQAQLLSRIKRQATGTVPSPTNDGNHNDHQ